MRHVTHLTVPRELVLREYPKSPEMIAAIEQDIELHGTIYAPKSDKYKDRK